LALACAGATTIPSSSGPLHIHVRDLHRHHDRLRRVHPSLRAIHIADFKAVGKFANQCIDNPLIVPSVGRLAQRIVDLDTQFARLVDKFGVDVIHNIWSSS
jgi:hypothetical protein